MSDAEWMCGCRVLLRVVYAEHEFDEHQVHNSQKQNNNIMIYDGFIQFFFFLFRLLLALCTLHVQPFIAVCSLKLSRRVFVFVSFSCFNVPCFVLVEWIYGCIWRVLVYCMDSWQLPVFSMLCTVLLAFVECTTQQRHSKNDFLWKTLPTSEWNSMEEWQRKHE